LNHRKLGVLQAAKDVGKNGDSARNIIGKTLRVGRIGVRCVDRYFDPFGLFGIQLQISGDEGAVRSGSLAFKGIEQASAFSSTLSCQGRRGGTFARTGDGE